MMPENARTWVLVSRNQGKAREFESLFRKHGIRFLSLADIGFEQEIAETGSTFAENARQKIEAVRESTDLPLLADDSGLEVVALKGSPGVRSARYGGPSASDKENRKKLLDEMEGIPNRTAGFRCALCFSLALRSGLFLSEGVCPGVISETESGKGGFGYDSIFVPQGFDKTFADLPGEMKNRISHRYQASVELAKKLF